MGLIRGPHSRSTPSLKLQLKGSEFTAYCYSCCVCFYQKKRNSGTSSPACAVLLLGLLSLASESFGVESSHFRPRLAPALVWGAPTA
jgi:hypothetical protein